MSNYSPLLDVDVISCLCTDYDAGLVKLEVEAYF